MASPVAVALGQVVERTSIIGASGTTTPAIVTNNMSLVGIFIPAAFTGTALTFSVSPTQAGTYVPLYNKSGQVTYTVAQGQFIAIEPLDFYGVQFLKIISNETEGTARTLLCSLKGI